MWISLISLSNGSVIMRPSPPRIISSTLDQLGFVQPQVTSLDFLISIGMRQPGPHVAPRPRGRQRIGALPTLNSMGSRWHIRARQSRAIEKTDGWMCLSGRAGSG
ncbi:hypothetical protein BCR44DRAFT_1441415 [Catenaria anguillulae PL171]|uniref:Uncharacterized protein n=1 Tax=Catenaria anguillulae PL171 TaxID=765915 RepID=A0A1Y2HD30_9FUNG|nr:hypothetical protein BCR44DRAFT_1441415 [Catenaria anguillulae PL171]